MPENRKFNFQLFAPEEQSPCSHKSSSTACASCRELAAAEQRVHELTSALEQALNKRRQLNTQCNSSHDPFSQIPTEVTCQIFALCCPHKPTLNEFYDNFHWFIKSPEEDGHEYPFQITLGSICQGWRRIIRSNPSFWNFLSLIISQKTSHTCATIVHQWLTRSTPLPLTIRIYFLSEITNTPNQNFNHPVMHPLIETLNTFIDRWSLVFLHIPNSFVGKLKSSRPPPLKSLILLPLDDHDTARSFRRKQDAVFWLGSTPSPSHLKISAYHLSNFSISWTKLTHFNGSYLTRDECVTILHQSPCLVHCEMYILDSVDSTGVNEPLLVHPMLIFLNLSGNPGILLSRLSCPALQSIQWHFSGHTISGVPTEFIVRSGCALISVELGVAGDENDLITFLALQPSIGSLSLHQMGPTFTTHFGQTAYTDNVNRRQFLPNLHFFEYNGTRDFPWSSIPAMVPLEPPSPTQMVSRPIGRLLFRLDFYARIHGLIHDGFTAEDLVLTDPIERGDLESILDVIYTGIDITIDNESGTKVIEFWMKRYHIGYTDAEDGGDDNSNSGHG